MTTEGSTRAETGFLNRPNGPCMLAGRHEERTEAMALRDLRTMRVKRVYEPAAPDDGARLLVDRLWPRGVKREALSLHLWLKEVAPSPALRRWFGHDPARWNEFQRRYFAELDGKPQTWQPILEAARKGNVTLLYAARDPAHNHAVALREYLIPKGKNA